MTIYVVGPECPNYPKRLAALPRAPTLRVKGTLPCSAGVALVGTRSPSLESEAFAFSLAESLADAGLGIWSGGALGIDGAAHRGALAAGGATVAVLGGGIGRPSPARHAELFETIARTGGAVVSQFEDDRPAAPYQFLMRNRVLAASVGVLVLIACGEQSGARNAVKNAREVGTRVGVVPHSPWSSDGTGCLLELRAGTHIISCVDDVLKLVDTAPLPAPCKQPRLQQSLPLPDTDGRSNAIPVSAQAQRLLERLSAPRHPDELAEVLTWPVSTVLTTLLELRLAQRVTVAVDGRYQRR